MDSPALTLQDLGVKGVILLGQFAKFFLWKNTHLFPTVWFWMFACCIWEMLVSDLPKVGGLLCTLHFSGTYISTDHLSK